MLFTLYTYHYNQNIEGIENFYLPGASFIIQFQTTNFCLYLWCSNLFMIYSIV